MIEELNKEENILNGLNIENGKTIKSMHILFDYSKYFEEGKTIIIGGDKDSNLHFWELFSKREEELNKDFENNQEDFRFVFPFLTLDLNQQITKQENKRMNYKIAKFKRIRDSLAFVGNFNTFLIKFETINNLIRSNIYNKEMTKTPVLPIYADYVLSDFQEVNQSPIIDLMYWNNNFYVCSESATILKYDSKSLKLVQKLELNKDQLFSNCIFSYSSLCVELVESSNLLIIGTIEGLMLFVNLRDFSLNGIYSLPLNKHFKIVELNSMSISTIFEDSTNSAYSINCITKSQHFLVIIK
jgi:hypothetical protein